jgi:hypothetical protein
MIDVGPSLPANEGTMDVPGPLPLHGNKVDRHELGNRMLSRLSRLDMLEVPSRRLGLRPKRLHH